MVVVVAVVAVAVLAEPSASVGRSEGRRTAEVLVTDVDGDARADVVGYLSAQGKLVWFKHEGTDSGASPLFGDEQMIDEEAPSPLHTMFMADFGADGFPDTALAVLLANNSAAVFVYPNGGPGVGFGARSKAFVHRALAAPGHATLSPLDVDGDGLVDVVVADAESLTWHRNLGGYAFRFEGSLSGPSKDAALELLLAATSPGAGQLPESTIIDSGVATRKPAVRSVEMGKRQAKSVRPKPHALAANLRSLQMREETSQGTRLTLTFGVVMACVSFALAINCMHSFSMA
ncbi:uncharacterized protein AMSG_04154 [Thecamonas trahens ATCC 50062]|uniref:Uncharacterized protein n=1 Tax=Thecamonas trahens ATCC 50062 TaxID=461836 RepID=A0A0L0D6T4_THETB|nr:hypothetical protein AMSG_04154 [Thecamonas trahens ATCC 50062]KNC47920.1 hypothetical protein AMSG_04154 [Thecamonas trahens ATCC 50062]|eukprot:XP_013758940.1 hypothetical protein AMSG_04154 [Thecamonas trahens ATCC 50062]